jgi:hypothetical protein
MTKLKSPEQLPDLLAELKRQNFYGEIRLTIKAGTVIRLVTEQSQIFFNEGQSHDNRNNR